MVSPGTILSYGTHSLQTVKYFRYSPLNTHTIVFIHGGAWRDPNNTYDDFLTLTNKLGENFNGAGRNGINMIGVNYRLSPEVKHPAHLVDVVNGLSFIQKTTPTASILLVGHSVGATLILQLLSFEQIVHLSGDADGSTDIISNLLQVLDTIYFVDGIYDIPELISEYGQDYKDFVMEAFRSEEQYKQATQLSFTPGSVSEPTLELGSKSKAVLSHLPRNILVIQSKEDELLSLKQTDIFVEFLKRMKLEYSVIKENWGKHEEVYRREELANLMFETEKH